MHDDLQTCEPGDGAVPVEWQITAEFELAWGTCFDATSRIFRRDAAADLVDRLIALARRGARPSTTVLLEILSAASVLNVWYGMSGRWRQPLALWKTLRLTPPQLVELDRQCVARGCSHVRPTIACHPAADAEVWCAQLVAGVDDRLVGCVASLIESTRRTS